MSMISLINAVPFGERAEKGYLLYRSLPTGMLAGLESENFRKTVQFVAKYSPFYRRRFQELGIQADKVRVPEDLGDFYTTAEDLRANPEDFICMEPDTAYETTGTTSKRPKRVYFSRTEVDEAGWAGAVGLWGLGVRKKDRVVSSFDYSFWVSGPVLVASCRTLGCFHIEAGRLDPEEFYDRVKDYRVSVVVGDPSWIVRFSEVAAKRGTWPMNVLIGGGENLNDEARKLVEDVWKTDYILSYGQTEAFGAIGIETRAKEGYHLNEFHNRFEIINREADGYGELVYTTLNRRVMPLVRYRSGDLTRFLEGPSKSGMPGRRISKLRGRVDEWTVTAMGNIAPWMFEPLFGSVKDLGGEWQITVDKEGAKDLVTFHVEGREGISEERLREGVLGAFQKEFAESWRVAQMGLLRIELKSHAQGSLRRESGRKMRRILDRRRF